MSKLGPKCQYFVWPPLFSSTALTLLAMEFTRASQAATAVLFHSSMTTSQIWWMLETLRSSTFCLRMPHRWSIGFRSGDMLGQSNTFTLSFFSKTVVVIMLEYCPAAQSPKGRGSCSASVCHSTCWHSWFPQWNVAPQCRQHSCSSRPPPCLTVGKTHLSLHSSPGCRLTRLTPSEPNKCISVSSDHRTCFQ